MVTVNVCICIFVVRISHAVPRVIRKIDAVSILTILSMSWIKAIFVSKNGLRIRLFGTMEQDFEKVPNLLVWVLLNRSS